PGSLSEWQGAIKEPEPFFSFARAAYANELHLHTNPQDMVESNWVGAISGRPILLRAGIIQPFDCKDLIVDPCHRNPRTAVALSMPRNSGNLPPRFLYVAVVDGRSGASHGMRMDELATLFTDVALCSSSLSMSCPVDAIALDGGASS